MVPIHLSLLGRSYTLLCEPGEEAQVRRLHELINSRAEALSRQVGNASDPRILMLLLLQFAEAQGESEQRIKALEAPPRSFLNQKGSSVNSELPKKEVP